MTEFGVAFGLVFLAEFGDKSMLLALAFATRYRLWPVIGGISIAAFTATGLATLVGAALGTALPQRGLVLTGGVAFCAFGLWMLLDNEEDDPDDLDDDDDGRLVRSRSVLTAVAASFLIAELGDKTTLATAALATTQAPLPTWAGAALGMTLAASIAAVVGASLGTRIPRRTTRLAAAVVFAVFGVLLLIEGMRM